jgi:hypothetical protein
MDDLELTHEQLESLAGLPEEYWACPLTIIALLVAHGEGRIHHQRAFEALRNSGLVEDWREKSGYVRTTERGQKFIEMLVATPLPEQRWVDPRQKTSPE